MDNKKIALIGAGVIAAGAAVYFLFFNKKDEDSTVVVSPAATASSATKTSSSSSGSALGDKDYQVSKMAAKVWEERKDIVGDNPNNYINFIAYDGVHHLAGLSDKQKDDLLAVLTKIYKLPVGFNPTDLSDSMYDITYILTHKANPTSNFIGATSVDNLTPGNMMKAVI